MMTFAGFSEAARHERSVMSAMVMANTAASAAANIHHGIAMRLVNCSSQREVMYHATGAATRKHAATIIAYRRLSMPIICEVVAP